MYQIKKNLKREIFRAYDIRGIVNEDFDSNCVYTIGLAFGSSVLDAQQSTVCVARDGRNSSPEFFQALSRGIRDSGCHVINIGAVPTPMLYFATHVLETQSGVMITGSHNPANYNGLKMVIAGHTLAESGVASLFERIEAQQFHRGFGDYCERDIQQQYIDTITQSVKLQRTLKIVIDCGNGIAGVVAGDLFRRLGCQVDELFSEVDGNFPNHHPDPSEAKNLRDLIARVAQIDADVGLAFDGDGDRLGIVTQSGKIIPPDFQLLLFACDILRRSPAATFIYDVKCSKHLPHIIRMNGGNPVMSRTGHSLVKEAMQQENALLAGEMSGHIFFKERWFGFDDGLYAGARMLEIIASSLRSLDEISNDLPETFATPEIKIAINENLKFQFVEKFCEEASFVDCEKVTIDGLRVEFTDGWGLLRASNTSPNLILRFEADNQSALNRIQNDFRAELRRVDEVLALDF